jgi:hypothetical protein
MTWDPASLSLRKVTAETTIDNQQLNVALTIGGQGFDTEDSMRAIFVRSGCAPTRENVIPVNDLKLVSGDHTVTGAICTKHKTPGAYDLLWWLTPPPSVSNPGNGESLYVPVNDVTVLPKAIEITTPARV